MIKARQNVRNLQKIIKEGETGIEFIIYQVHGKTIRLEVSYSKKNTELEIIQAANLVQQQKKDVFGSISEFYRNWAEFEKIEIFHDGVQIKEEIKVVCTESQDGRMKILKKLKENIFSLEVNNIEIYYIDPEDETKGININVKSKAELNFEPEENKLFVEFEKQDIYENDFANEILIRSAYYILANQSEMSKLINELQIDIGNISKIEFIYNGKKFKVDTEVSVEEAIITAKKQIMTISVS